MPANVEGLQQLVCAVVEHGSPILEIWLTGGSGSQAHPLKLELLGQLSARTISEAGPALERLLEERGPHLNLDLEVVDFIDADGQLLLTRLEVQASGHQGRITLGPPREAPGGDPDETTINTDSAGTD